jgi:putative membrane protein
MSKYRLLLLCAFVAVWIWAAIHPLFPHDWLLENYLVFLFVPVLLISGRYFKLSDVSYTLITLFLILHVVGSHYTYAEVPFGFTLQKWLGAQRNMYDRLVHFTFGFLLTYPMREVFIRITKVQGFWGLYLPLDVTLSFSALYEIMEWWVARNVAPAAGIAFLGSQGDIWDAQKDMAMAGIGALLAMIIIAFINWKWNPDFGRELRSSLRIERGDRPLGEQRLQEWLKPKAYGRHRRA